MYTRNNVCSLVLKFWLSFQKGYIFKERMLTSFLLTNKQFHLTGFSWFQILGICFLLVKKYLVKT